jgi:HTH-type transcriptional regulator/antitoxin HipB
MDQSTRSAQQLGAALRQRRRALGLTQSDIASRTKIRQATVSSAEAGEPMQLDTLLHLLAALDVEILLRERTKVGALNGDEPDLRPSTKTGEAPYSARGGDLGGRRSKTRAKLVAATPPQPLLILWPAQTSAGRRFIFISPANRRCIAP